MKCEGCKTKRDIYKSTGVENMQCILKTNAPKRCCPCSNCIVKPMCTMQCDRFKSVLQSIFELPLSYNYKSIHPPQHAWANRVYYSRIF